MLMTYDVTLLAIYTLTLASVTRLVTGMDTITERAHEWLVTHIEAISDWAVGYFDTTRYSSGWWTVQIIRGACWFAEKMLSCLWCAPFWISGLMLLGYQWWTHPVVLFFALMLAMRFVAATLITIGR